MKIKHTLLVVLALSLLGICNAQIDETITREELLRLIAEEKQGIKQEAKILIVDTLPELMKTDPEAADQALARYSGVLNTMDQEDVLYLLGHLYAKMGENTRAIGTFNSLLKSKLNDDARKMLNLVLYDQMISYLQKNDRKTAKEFLQAIVFENFNIDRYYPSYLYIWADISAEEGEYDSVNSMLETYNQNRDTIMNTLLPQKKQIIGRVNDLDINAFYRNSSQDEYKKISTQIDNIKKDLTSVYSQLISLKGIIYLDDVVKLHKDEIEMLDGLQKNLSSYMTSTEDADRIISEGLSKLQAIKQFTAASQKQIDVMDGILQKQYEKLLANDPELISGNQGDFELIRLIEIENNIDVCNSIIAELDEAIADPELADARAQLQNRRAEWSERRTDYQIRKDTYLQTRIQGSDIENDIFNDLLMEYYATKQGNRELELQLAEIESFFREDAKQIFDDQNREDLKSRVDTDIMQVANSTERDEAIMRNARGIMENLEFIRLQLAYRNLRFKDQARIAQSGSLTEEQMIAKQEEILAEKRDLITRLQDFLNNNPDFKAIEQPDSTFLVTNADLHYILAELQYSVDVNNPQAALENYRRVVQLGPNFIHRDAALYNVGYISSQQKKLQIDENRNRFYELNANALALDEASKYNYSDFAEAIESYQSIVDNHKDSEYYDESLYRMGVLNYHLATDSDQPARYYSLAINQFDEIIAKPESKFKYDALYQRGWLRLNSTEDQDLRLAMGDFLTLLNAIENKQITDPVLVKDYRDDAVNNIAYCLIALDGLDFNSQAKGVTELQNVFANYSNKDVIKAVVDQAAIKKFNLDASMQAVDFLWLKIGLAPLALENPSYLDSILMVVERDSGQLREGQDISSLRQDIYLNLITNYGKDSDWYAENKDKNIAPQLVVVRKAYDERSKRLKNEFIADASSESKLAAYKAHMDSFEAFGELFPNDLAAWKQNTMKEELVLSTMLAESSQLPKNYLNAISNIRNFNDGYPDDEDYFLHEGLSYTYANNIYDLLKDRYAEPGFTPEAGLPESEDALFGMLNSNAQQFISVLTGERFKTPEREEQAVGILLTLGDAQYIREKYPQATELYLKALEQQALISDASKFDIYGKLAQMAERENDYTKSEQYYRSALQFAQTPEQRDAITNSIFLQIQNNYTAAETGLGGQPDYSLAAQERLRLADQLPSTDVSRIQGLKWAAHQSFVNAKEYQKAIDLVLQLAGDKTDVEEVYAYYFRASEIAAADSLMGNKELGKTIRQDFIAKYPSSNRAYALRLADILEMQKDPTQQEAAAEAYLVMHQEARNKSINIGTDPEDALMVNAAISYRNAGKKDKEIEVYKNFIETYPSHQNVIPYMEYIADDYRAKGDTLRFEQMAKDIYMKDKTKTDRYKYVADYKLHQLWYGFDTAYKNNDYAKAFEYRDDYRKMEAAYIKEGLTFNSAGVYEYFAAVQKEYDDIQKRTAFFRTYDNQLTAIEKGNLMTSAPAKLITVNANTTWEKHMVGGARRIPALKTAVNNEVAKVNKLLETANESGFDLDNARRLRAYDLIANIYEKGADVIETQIGYYMRNTVEAGPYRQEYPGDALLALIGQATGGQNSDLLSMAATTHINVYNRYALAGYDDKYTQRSKSKLSEWNILPDYKVDEYPMSNGWSQKIGDSTSSLASEAITSPLGVKLGKVTIPANSDLKLTRMIPVKIAPDFALLHLVYPYEMDLKLNGNKLESSAVPTDTLVTGKPVTTRYAYFIPAEAWGDGQNIIEINAPNESPESQALSLNLQVYTDRKRIAESIPNETVMLYSDNSWKVVQSNTETGTETTVPAVYASNFGINPDQIDSFAYANARAIWTTEEAPVENVVFETSFMLDTEFREGTMEFIAPESATIMINGQALEGSYAFDYDSDPFMVYPISVPLNKEYLQQGKNTIRFVVNNNTAYRGFMAAVTIIKAGKEELR